MKWMIQWAMFETRLGDLVFALFEQGTGLTLVPVKQVADQRARLGWRHVEEKASER